jgi:hypothetical protein
MSVQKLTQKAFEEAVPAFGGGRGRPLSTDAEAVLALPVGATVRVEHDSEEAYKPNKKGKMKSVFVSSVRSAAKKREMKFRLIRETETSTLVQRVE